MSSLRNRLETSPNNTYTFNTNVTFLSGISISGLSGAIASATILSGQTLNSITIINPTLVSYPVANSTYTVWISGNCIQARNNHTGIIDFSGDNSVDAAIPINAALNNIKNIASTPSHVGGTVFVMQGQYLCKSEIAIDSISGGNFAWRHGIGVQGEGIGTFFDFVPTSGDNHNGVRMRGNYNSLRNCMIRINDRVFNGILAQGASGTQYNWGLIENVSVNSSGSTIPTGRASTATASSNVVSGQIGLHMVGKRDVSGYFAANYKVHNCEFFCLDTGIYCEGQNVDMCNWSNIHIGACEVGWIIEGVQHNITNVRIEGGGGVGSGNSVSASTIGSRGIWLREPRQAGETSGQVGGNINMLNNINVELHKFNSQGILSEAGVNNNFLVSQYNSSNDSMSAHAYVDNHTFGAAQFDYREMQQGNRVSRSRRRTGQIIYGSNASGGGHEGGILAGNVKYQVDGADTNLAVTAFTNGPFASLTTAAASGSVACVFFNMSGITRNNYPNFYTRFLPNSTNCRIFMGLWNGFSAPTGNANVLSGMKGMGLYYDSLSGTHWRFMHNDASGTASVSEFPTVQMGDVTYGSGAITTGAVQAVSVNYDNGNPSCNVRHHGRAYDWRTSGQIPLSGGFQMGFLIYIENQSGSAAKTLRLFETEYTWTAT